MIYYRIIMRFNSIRNKLLFILVPLVILSILIVGISGIFYFHDVTKNTIWDNQLAQAKAVSVFSDNYLNSSTAFLESIADRPFLIQSIKERNATLVYRQLMYAVNKSTFSNVYVTDDLGIVLYSYPNQSIIGKDFSGMAFLKNTLTFHNKSIDAINNSNIWGSGPAICISVPIIDNDSMIGTLTGVIDTDTFAAYLFNAQIENVQFVRVENRSGNVIVYPDKSWMNEMKDVSALPSSQSVRRGETGVNEQYNRLLNEERLDAYTPMKSTGWGVTISEPIDVAYAPINHSTSLLGIFVVIMALITGIIAYLLGNNIIKPLLGIMNATKEMAVHGDYHKSLPVHRDDEIGDLARSFDTMAHQLIQDREVINEEKNRAELYLDVMGHDINNMNQSAMSNLELIQDDSNLNDEQKKSINHALIATQGSANLIDNVRKLQKITQEKLEFEPVDINDMILACIKEAPKPDNKKVILNYNPRKGLMVNGTPLLKEVFCNLIGNSIKYSGDEVTIDITVNDTLIDNRHFYSVSVADNGMGIPDETKPKLFYRFQRGSTKAHGKGLGLYIVKSIVERIGGSVTVEDRVKGDYTRGSKFIMNLLACEECK
jgi:two-component system, sensor histidine kinase